MNVAGESHYQPALRELAGEGAHGERVRVEATAALVPEPANPHDANAVMVRIGDRLVGYLPRTEAVAYVAMIAALSERGRVATCNAVIAGWVGSALGVFLTLPEPGENAETELSRRW